MTGEMHKSEVTKEAFPLHFKLAKKYRGRVMAFDYYQGPYVFIEGKGRIWLSSDDGVWAYWYADYSEIASSHFPINALTARAALKAYAEMNL